MREIRLRWNDRVSHAGHEVDSYANWERATTEVRRDLEIIVKTANELYGPRSHWIEEREARRPDRKSRLRFDKRVLQGETAASPYAHQLTTGFSNLRFKAPLEQEFLDHVNDSHRHAAWICAWLALVAWIGLGSAALLYAPSPVWIAAHVVVAVGLGASIYLLSTRRVMVPTNVLAIALWLPIALVTVLWAFLHPVGAASFSQFAALLVIAAGFAPIGLVWARSLPVTLAVVGACALVALAVLPRQTHDATLGFAGVLLSGVAVAAVGAYFRERMDREQFLLLELLARQAHVDPLTGLQNRRGADYLTQIARLQALRDNVIVSFVMIEIADFREYNDRHGREAGDAVLMEVKKILSHFARRPLDVASRIGGTAFGLLLYDCNVEQACAHAEKLREAFTGVSVAQAGSLRSGALIVNMSAVELLPDERAQDVYRRAEKLLARSRRSGIDPIKIFRGAPRR